LTSLRVLTVAHNAVAASNRRRMEVLAALPDVEVTLLTPPWWHEEGQRLYARPAGRERGTSSGKLFSKESQTFPRRASRPDPSQDGFSDEQRATSEEQRFARSEIAWRVGQTVLTGNGTRHLYVSGLVEAIRATRPHVIDLFEEPFSLVALQTLLLRELFAPSAALVFYSAVNVERVWRWPYRAIERLVLARADAAHAPNVDVPRILHAKGFAGPSAVIPLGVDVQRFAEAEPLALDQLPRPRIGFVGRLEPVKGLPVLLDAFSRMHTPADLFIVGDGSERQHLLATPQERVHLLPALEYERVPALLKALDVLVLPSITLLPLHREQFGRVLVEAMAAGILVVGSDSGAIPEVIGDAGLVVPERDAPALAAALDRVLTDTPLRQTLIDKGRRRVAGQFAWPVVAEQTLTLFRAAQQHRQRALRGLQEAHA
jgi:glycosyltransferase involved in cell wall biosynthesis